MNDERTAVDWFTVRSSFRIHHSSFPSRGLQFARETGNLVPVSVGSASADAVCDGPLLTRCRLGRELWVSSTLLPRPLKRTLRFAWSFTHGSACRHETAGFGRSRRAAGAQALRRRPRATAGVHLAGRGGRGRAWASSSAPRRSYLVLKVGHDRLGLDPRGRALDHAVPRLLPRVRRPPGDDPGKQHRADHRLGRRIDRLRRGRDHARR